MPNLATVYSREAYSDPYGNDHFVREDQPFPVAQGGIRNSASWRVTSAADTAGVVTIAAPALSHEALQFSGIVWSYSGDPTGGNILVQDGSTTILDFDVTAGGPGFMWFPSAWTITPNAALVLTIHAGGGALIGKAGFLQVRVVDTSLEVDSPSASSIIIIPGL